MSARPDCLIVDTGRSNAASLAAALERAGAGPRLAVDPGAVRVAPDAVLPGVGAFGPVAERLRASGLGAALAVRLAEGRPTLGVCLGMQLFFERSDESPGASGPVSSGPVSSGPVSSGPGTMGPGGVGALKGVIEAYPSAVPSPQFGWNRVGPSGDYAYFANSYALKAPPPGWLVARADYGGPFVAALERGSVLLCQFHPELSGSWGLALLGRWLDKGAGRLDGPMLAGALGEPVPAGRAAGRASSCARLIPCLDAKDGRVVKGVRFEGLRDSGDPAELAARYEAEGADEIVVLDISAGVEGRATALETIRAVRRAVGLPICAGGGIATLADAERALAAGADKVSMNSRAYREPGLLSAVAGEFGRQACVVAIDATRAGETQSGSKGADARRSSGGALVVLDAGRTVTDTPVRDWVARAVKAGAGEILLTSRDRDGTRSGYDLGLIAEAREAAGCVPIIASGGGAGAAHAVEALAAGADAALLAGVLHDGSSSLPSIKNEMRRLGAEVRIC